MVLVFISAACPFPVKSRAGRRVEIIAMKDKCHAARLYTRVRVLHSAGKLFFFFEILFFFQHVVCGVCFLSSGALLGYARLSQ